MFRDLFEFLLSFQIDKRYSFSPVGIEKSNNKNKSVWPSVVFNNYGGKKNDFYRMDNTIP